MSDKTNDEYLKLLVHPFDSEHSEFIYYIKKSVFFEMGDAAWMSLNAIAETIYDVENEKVIQCPNLIDVFDRYYDVE